jgi:chromosome partitioning protein
MIAMGMIWAIMNQKGGTGKTESTVNIGHGLELRGKSVIYADRDNQQSLQKRGSIGNIFKAVEVLNDKVDIELARYKASHDFVLLDCPPRVDSATVKIIKVSDLIIIPIQPSPVDLWASSCLVELIKLCQETGKGTPKVVFLITMSSSNTILSKQIIPLLEETGFPILKQQMTRLEIYKRSAELGETVFSTAPNKASKEMDLIIDEILELA